MITPEEFKQAQITTRRILEVIFNVNYEKDFRSKVLKGNGWHSDSFEVERAHMSGSVFRLLLKHEDLREKEVYVCSEEVYNWYYELGKGVTDARSQDGYFEHFK